MTIENYNQTDKEICDKLYQAINAEITNSKIWHGHPVWFIDDNPIVGYAKRKDYVTLLFWSGQSFDEEKLHKIGKFKAAEIHYTSAEQIDTEDLTRWLKKSKEIQWDYKNLIKRKGVLEKLK